VKLVIIESPFAGTDEEIVKNIKYARQSMRDSLLKGEAPLASHLLYTQEGILEDRNPEERRLGISAGLAWGEHAELTAVYADLGITKGMEQGIERAKKERREIVFRYIF